MLEILLLIFGLLILLPYILIKQKDAPFVPLEPEVVEEVMKLARIKKEDIFYDLGSGDGRLVIAAALRGVKEAYGVELDFKRVIYSRIWTKILRLKNVNILKQDLFQTDLSKATVITCYLLQETNDKLIDKFNKELRKGTRIVSIAFSLPGLTPVAISPKGPIYGPVYVYEI